jgi:hypothetical protein
METNDSVKILIIDSGSTPIKTFKHELPAEDKQRIKVTILEELNRLGKAAHALIKYKDKFWVADHMAEGKAPSTEYHKHSVRYHPFMGELV